MEVLSMTASFPAPSERRRITIMLDKEGKRMYNEAVE
jgi:hypothetical protein